MEAIIEKTGLSPLTLVVAGTLFVTFLLIQITPKPESKGGKKGVQYPNGPSPFPLFGNIFSFAALKQRPDRELLNIARKYGQICMLWFGSNPVIIISSPKLAKELMDKRGSIYSSRPEQNPFRATVMPWRLVTTPAGETFRLLRKIYHNLLGPKSAVTFRKYQNFESKVFLTTLLDSPSGFLMDVERFAMSVIFSAVYGVRLDELDHPAMKEFYSLWEVMLKYFQPGSLLLDFFPALQHLPKFMQPKLKLASNLRTQEIKLHRAFLETLKKQVREGCAPQCFGSLLVQIQEDENIDDEKACDILAMLIGAGADTTSSYLQSFFKVMALHPKVMQKAHEELDRVVGPKRLPVWEDEMNLPYVRALIKEVHRWAPIGSLGIPHATSKSDVVDGRTIPNGTIVFPNLTALSRDSDRYQDPDTFEPERFLGDDLDASSSAVHPDYMKRDHFHYGFGRRLCQGIFVAEASLYIVVSRVLWGFDITPMKGAKPLDMDAKMAGLVTKPKPYKVSITSRGPQFEKVIRQSRLDAKTDILNFDDVVFAQ
ncbi:hypothetical protein V494_03953 [Pseudogymnoascus sp. VKM F-4513 (FW-928)]|nr:hypothetical protein V494_03953 [Pseudogymnoascus sp. VKM F-4513 (FW-928)]